MTVLSSMLNFARGMNPAATRLILGTFEFLDFEIPERIALGAKQQTTVHKLVGGRRVIDVMGVDYDPITWSGIISGKNTAARVRTLEQMRDAGEVLPLTLDEYSFDVLISSFVPTYEWAYRRPYTIELLVRARNDAPKRANTLSGALDALINSDVGKAMNLSNTINVSSVTDAVTAVQSAVSQVRDIAHATVDAVQSIVKPIVAAQQLVSTTITSLESSLGEITTLGGLVPGNPVSLAVSRTLSQATALTQTSALYQMQNVLGRLNKNVQAGQTADGVSSVTQTGGNLCAVAAKAYLDQSLWPGIAMANNRTDPWLTGINTIIIPSNPSS
ncbi:hypothetical protein [Paludibacterium yongneupense]|uniref:hypothetical protein n=1 Tax=Paludibacterium yongneupense TaxID=400061 RepID=UPI0004067F44|nr:hypothetical protein [Paludibacterium yongneupense]